ncbi:hypothetical protein GCM10011282_12170 [Undibacterium macrobrachii]|uniref:Uncharacterized protein n=1 Tax=Undibacterium macrobrachii TaxID=1119058 RepID=A0ABQ2XAG0_9BURK|nr:hypothetical protein GCM10011282_12170 [Undibacterium macrobrachii]
MRLRTDIRRKQATDQKTAQNVRTKAKTQTPRKSIQARLKVRETRHALSSNKRKGKSIHAFA